MTVLQMLVILLGLANCLAVACRLDAMTWRTHRWRPQLITVALGLCALAAVYRALHHPDPRAAFVAQLLISIVLLHTLPQFQGHRAQQLQRDGVQG